MLEKKNQAGEDRTLKSLNNTRKNTKYTDVSASKKPFVYKNITVFSMLLSFQRPPQHLFTVRTFTFLLFLIWLQSFILYFIQCVLCNDFYKDYKSKIVLDSKATIEGISNYN